MPRSTDNANHPSTLPPPELNPLINPILGQNMGRWAEVYFTSAPEKREEAVLELLRELQAEGSENQDRAVPVLPKPQNSVTQTSPPSRIEELQPQPGRCPSCGRENPPRHKFCGMCGTPLVDELAAMDSLVDLRVDHAPQGEGVSSVENPQADFLRGRDRDIDDPTPASLKSAPSWTASEASVSEDPESTPTFAVFPRSYRLYVGSALALLIMALVYIAWRGGQATSQTAGLPPEPAASTAPAHAAAPTAPPPKTDDTSPSGGARSSQSAAEPAPRKLARAAVPAEATQTSVPNTTASGARDTQLASAGGAKELAIAESYLNGTNGQQRNVEEAVQWLWKAVGKGSASATLELSEVYLSGDGVPKNCDQARVLLQAAATKGVKQAGERLRNLQSFGCE